MPGGAPARNESQIETVGFQGESYTLCRILSRGEAIIFVICSEDADLVFSISTQWIRNGKYIGVNKLLGGVKRHRLLHRLILGLTGEDDEDLVEEENNQDKSGDHINRHELDNRRCNLRLATQAQQNHNTKDRDRIAVLPPGCGISSKDLPRYIHYSSARGLHGETFRVHFLDYRWSSSKSKELTLKEKLEQAKAHLRHLAETQPERFVGTYLDPAHVALARSLKQSFNSIIMASTFPEEEKLANLITIDEPRDLLAPDPTVRQVPVIEKNQVLVSYNTVLVEGQPKYVHLKAEREEDTINLLYDFEFNDLVQKLSLAFDTAGARVIITEQQKRLVPFLKDYKTKKVTLREILFRQKHVLPDGKYLSAFTTTTEDMRMENLILIDHKEGPSPNTSAPDALQEVLPCIKRLPKYCTYQSDRGRTFFVIQKHPGLLADGKIKKKCNSSPLYEIEDKYEDLVDNLKKLYSKVGMDFETENAKWNRLHDEFKKFTA